MSDTGRKFGPFRVTHPVTGNLKTSEVLRSERMQAITDIEGWKVVSIDVGDVMQHVVLEDGLRYLDVMLWRNGQYEEAKLREPHHTHGYVLLDRLEFARVTLDGLSCVCPVIDDLDQWTRHPECMVHIGEAA